MIASPSRTAPSATSSPMLPARSPGLSSSFFATPADGAGPTEVGDEPVTREGAQTPHRAPFGGGSGALLVQLSHLAGLGYRGPDAPARAPLRRSLGFESRRRVVLRSPASGSRQREQTSLFAAGAGNRATAGSLSAAGTARSLHRRALRLAERPRPRSPHDPCGIAVLVPLSSSAPPASSSPTRIGFVIPLPRTWCAPASACPRSCS